MPTLYLTENNATMRRTGNHLIVTGPENRPECPVRERSLLDLKAQHIDAIALVGNTHITSDASLFCLRLSIPVAWLSYTGDYLGRLAPESDRNAELRLAQCAVALDPEQKLQFAKCFVDAKCRNAAATLDAIRSNHTGNKLINKTIKMLKKCGRTIQQCMSLESLRGIEGDHAKHYFAAFAQVFTAATICASVLAESESAPIRVAPSTMF